MDTKMTEPKPEPDIILKSPYHVEPCYEDLITYTIGHDNYSEDRQVLIDADKPERHVTLKYARSFVSGLIGNLKDHGVGPGDTVCLHMFNDIMYPLLFLGILGVGAYVTAANPAYTVAEMEHHFRASRTKFVISMCDCTGRAKEAARAVGNITDISRRNMDEFVTGIDTSIIHDHVRFNDRETATKTIACLNSTSGTTGSAKMAARSHHSLVMEDLAIQDMKEKPYEVRRLLCTPFFHGFTLPLAVVSALRHGLPTYIMPRFDTIQFLQAIEEHKITETAMPPPLLVRFLAVSPEDRMPLKTLRLVWCGGAAVTKETQQRALVELFDEHNTRICQVWGLTETGWVTTFHYPERDDTGAVGRLLASYEAKVARIYTHINEGKGHAQLLNGELWVKSPINMIGYYGDKTTTRTSMTKHGWLKTGDLGYYNHDEKFYVSDRLKDLIKVRGWQVSPSEIESRLMEHPDITDAAVIGVKRRDEGTEFPLLFVVRRPGTELDAEAIKAFLMQTLAKYKIEDCGVKFKDEIPKNPSGKILKTDLKFEAAVEEADRRGERRPWRSAPPSDAYGYVSPTPSEKERKESLDSRIKHVGRYEESPFSSEPEEEAGNGDNE